MLAWIRRSAAFKARHWPWMALIASALMLGAAHYFETFEGLAPCVLCLKQREAYWAAGTIALVGIAGGFTPWRDLIFKICCFALAIAFAYGVYLAGWHVGAEQGWWPGPSACSGAASASVVSAEDIASLMDATEPVKVISCEDPVWWYLGLTMAGWNLIISSALAIFSVYAGLKGRKA